MRSEFLPFNPPNIGDEEIAEVVDTLKSQWITSGPKTKAFEDSFREYVGAESVIAVNSCTAGLHLSLLAQGVGPGDEVITTPMTFCATANVIEHVGARVVLADIEKDGFLLDPNQVAKKISASTRAILPVHYSGDSVDLAAFDELVVSEKSRRNAMDGNRKSLDLIEDAAHALPTEFGTQRIGSRKNLACFSFYATKNLTTAEGGMITGATELIDRIRPMALHGMSKDAWKRFDKSGTWQYDLMAPGFKYNMTDIQASLGSVQLRRLGEFQEKRRTLWEFYNRSLATLSAVQLPPEYKGRSGALHLYVLRLNLEQISISRDQFYDEMKLRNVGCSVHYTPIHLFSYYAKKYSWKPSDYPNALAVFDRMISIPFHPKLELKDAETVVEAIEDICRKFRR